MTSCVRHTQRNPLLWTKTANGRTNVNDELERLYKEVVIDYLKILWTFPWREWRIPHAHVQMHTKYSYNKQPASQIKNWTWDLQNISLDNSIVIFSVSCAPSPPTLNNQGQIYGRESPGAIKTWRPLECLQHSIYHIGHVTTAENSGVSKWESRTFDNPHKKQMSQ
jgi:hypothetical protein